MNKQKNFQLTIWAKDPALRKYLSLRISIMIKEAVDLIECSMSASSRHNYIRISGEKLPLKEIK